MSVRARVTAIETRPMREDGERKARELGVVQYVEYSAS
jgi:hypothetical protein